MFLKNGSMIRRLASLHWLSRGIGIRQLRQYYQDAMTPCSHPAALRFLRLAVPRFHSLCSLLDGRVRRRGLELVTRYLQPGLSEETTGSLKFLGNPNCPFAHVPIRRRQDCLHQTIKCSNVALGHRKAKAPTKGLSALNSMAFGLAVYASPSSLPPPTQDSLPAAGQALPDGLSTRKTSTKGFKVVSLHLIPLSQALLGAMNLTAAGAR